MNACRPVLPAEEAARDLEGLVAALQEQFVAGVLWSVPTYVEPDSAAWGNSALTPQVCRIPYLPACKQCLGMH